MKQFHRHSCFYWSVIIEFNEMLVLGPFLSPILKWLAIIPKIHNNTLFVVRKLVLNFHEDQPTNTGYITKTNCLRTTTIAPYQYTTAFSLKKNGPEINKFSTRNQTKIPFLALFLFGSSHHQKFICCDLVIHFFRLIHY